MWALVEPHTMTELGLASRDSTDWIRKKGPFRLMSMSRSQVPAVQSSSGRCVTSPALANSTSRRGQRSASCRASACCEATSPASLRISQALSPSSRPACSRACALRPVMATVAPSARNWRAVSSPMPLLPPVIKANLSFSRVMEKCPVSLRKTHSLSPAVSFAQ